MPLAALLAGLWASTILEMFIQTDAFDDASSRAVVLITSIGLLVVAVFITFMGYKHFSTALILQSAILGGYMGWYIGGAFNQSSETNNVMVNFAVAIALGIFFIIFACCMKGLMRFLFGVALGVQIGGVLNVIWLHSLQSSINNSNPNNIGYIAMGCFGLLLGCMAYFSGRRGHIILTAWVGAYWIIQAIGNFIGNFPSLFYPFPRDSRTAKVSKSYYMYIGAWAFLGFLGMMTQFYLTTFDSNFHEFDQMDDEDDDMSLAKDYHKSRTPYLQEVSV